MIIWTGWAQASYGSEGTTSPDHDSGQSSTLNSTGVASEFHDYVARQRRNERNGKTTPPDDAPADAPPTPDYSSDSAGSHESLAIADPEEIPPAPSQPPTPPPSQKNAGAGESLSKARSDTSGNFLLGSYFIRLDSFINYFNRLFNYLFNYLDFKKN